MRPITPITAKTAQAIRQLTAEGQNTLTIATLLGLHRRQVTRILNQGAGIDEAEVVRMARQDVPVRRLCHVFFADQRQIADILARHGIEPVKATYQKQPREEKPKVRYEEENAFTTEDRFWRMKPGKPNPMGMARHVWQGKLTDTDGCVKLNGQPIKFHDLMRKTNAALVGWGLPQMDACPEWVVEKTVD